MSQTIVIAGFKNQSVIRAGRLLAEAAAADGFQVGTGALFPPRESLSGTSAVITVSDRPVSLAVVRFVDILIPLNQKALDAYAYRLKPGGYLLYNSSAAHWSRPQPEINPRAVPADELAEASGGRKLASIVMLGALAVAVPRLSFNSFPATLPDGARAAFEAGYRYFSPHSIPWRN